MSLETTGLLQVTPDLSDGTVITSPSADAWSAWTAFITTAAAPSVLMGFNFPNTDATVTTQAVWAQIQFSIGTLGAEEDGVIATYLLRVANQNLGPKLYLFDPPMEAFPTGTRLSVRHRASQAATFQYRLLYFTGFDSDHQLGSVATPLTCIPGPADASVTPTCVITPPSSAWQWTDWATLAAAGTYSTEISLVSLAADAPGTGPADVHVQVGIGGAGSEAPIADIRDWVSNGTTGKLNTLPFPRLYPLAPPSPRLSVRFKKSTTATDTWTFGLRLYAGTALLEQADEDEDDPPQVGPDPDEREIHVGPDARGIWVRPDLWLRKGLVNDDQRSMPIWRGQ